MRKADLLSAEGIAQRQMLALCPVQRRLRFVDLGLRDPQIAFELLELELASLDLLLPRLDLQRSLAELFLLVDDVGLLMSCAGSQTNELSPP
jgi:hypothetical protein